MRSPRTATKSSPSSPQLEKACVQQRRPNAAKNKQIHLFKKKKRKKESEGGGKKEKYATEALWGLQCLAYLLSDPLKKKYVNVCYRTLNTEVKRTSSNKTLKPFYLWIYILTRAKRKSEADLFHPIKDLV